MNISTRITVNGQIYHTTDEMPPEVRAQYERAMAMIKGGDGDASTDVQSTSVVSESIVCNGRTYQNRDELPLEIQALIDKTAAANSQKSTSLHIKRTGTFGPQVAFQRDSAEDERAAADPVLAWTLVKALSVAVVILLFLLGAKHFGWW